MSLRAKLARLFLVAALLAAQHGAIAHAVWHSTDGSRDKHSGTESSLLCEQHTALGTVLGVLGNAQPSGAASAQREAAVAAVPQAGAPATPLSASSRDPPTGS